VKHESDAGTDQECAYQRHSNGQGEQQTDLDYNFQFRVTLPPTVLFTELDNGALVVQGRPDGPRVWLSPTDAVNIQVGSLIFGVSGVMGGREM
jgi:hypothetical protein